MYYAVADKEHNVTIHKGDKSGPVLATASQCLAKDGVTDIHLTSPKETIQMEHVHRLLPFFHGKTLFTVNGKKYHWKGHTMLINDQTGFAFAGFHPRFLEPNFHKLGTLIVMGDGKNMLDIVVISCLVLQERSDEGKLGREMARLQVRIPASDVS